MGYTHYWRTNNVSIDYPAFSKFAKVVKTVLKIAKHKGVEIGDCGGEGGSPVVDGDIIALNGIGGGSHESFVLEREADGFNFWHKFRTLLLSCLAY